MENETKGLSSGNIMLIVILIALVIGIGYIGTNIYKDVKDYNEITEDLKVAENTDIKKLNDSTYHVNLGDGACCFTIQKANDSLFLSGTNILMASVTKDSIYVKSNHKYPTTYSFSYHQFYGGERPDRSQILFDFN